MKKYDLQLGEYQNIQLSGKEMTWAYLFQGTRIDENIKIY
jgi:hypothetical protein